MGPDIKYFPNVKHPAFITGGQGKFIAWGQRKFHDLYFIGYINRKMAAGQIIPRNRLPKALERYLYSDVFMTFGSDTNRLAVRIVDSYRTPLPYPAKSVKFSLEHSA